MRSLVISYPLCVYMLFSKQYIASVFVDYTEVEAFLNYLFLNVVVVVAVVAVVVVIVAAVVVAAAVVVVVVVVVIVVVSLPS